MLLEEKDVQNITKSLKNQGFEIIEPLGRYESPGRRTENRTPKHVKDDRFIIGHRMSGTGQAGSKCKNITPEEMTNRLKKDPKNAKKDLKKVCNTGRVTERFLKTGASDQGYRRTVIVPYGRPRGSQTVTVRPAKRAGISPDNFVLANRPADGNRPSDEQTQTPPGAGTGAKGSILDKLQSDDGSLVIAVDTEFYYFNKSIRRVLSYQFTVYFNGVYHDFIYIVRNSGAKGAGAGDRLSLYDAIAVVLRVLGIDPLVRQDQYAQRVCLGRDERGDWVYEDLIGDRNVIYEHAHRIYPYGPTEDGHWEPYGGSTIDEMHEAGTFDKFQNWEKQGVRGSRRVLNTPKEETIPVTVLCHYGIADLSAFSDFHWIKWSCNDIQDGLVSLDSSRQFVNLSDQRYDYKRGYTIRITYRDTMAQAPPGAKSLDNLAKSVGESKKPLEQDEIENMNLLLINNPDKFIDYAVHDTLITLKYYTALYGDNVLGAVTMTSGGAALFRDLYMEYRGLKDVQEFDGQVRGMVPAERVLKSGDDGQLISVGDGLVGVNGRATDVINLFIKGYYGGLNASMLIGYHDKPTYDHDIIGAYGTAMSILPDPDWSVPGDVITNRRLKVKDFMGDNGKIDLAKLLFVGRIRYTHKKGTYMPCIPQKSMDSIVWTRKSYKDNTVVACGPEILMALQQGATVHVDVGYYVTPLRDDKGDMMFTCRKIMADLMQERIKAQDDYGKKSIQDLTLKIIINGIYGKMAQGLSSIKRWQPRLGETDYTPLSSVTNAYYASLLTSLVRALLLGVLNELHDDGVPCYSVTTDGFITDVDVDTVAGLHAGGMTRLFSDARKALTGGDGRIWETKHHQDQFLNFSTRGNVAFNVEGVEAAAGLYLESERNTPEKREELILKILASEIYIPSVETRFTSFKELYLKKKEDFGTYQKLNKLRPHFDCKRQPVLKSMRDQDVPYNGNTYTFAGFDTVPHDTIMDFRRYKTVEKEEPYIRTKSGWVTLDDKAHRRTKKGLRISDIMYATVRSVVMLHRLGYYHVPGLDNADGTVSERLEWLNSLDLCDKEFTRSAWDNTTRANRRHQMYIDDHVLKMLKQLNATKLKELD